MAIFGTNYNTLPLENMRGTDEEFLSIMTESYKDSYKLEAGMYVADAMIEQQVLTEGADACVLLEGFLGGFWEKTKEFFKKLWTKIKSWFNAFIRAFKIMVLSGEKFIKEFEKELTRKVDTGYEYQSYEYKNLEMIAPAELVIDMADKYGDMLSEIMGKSVEVSMESYTEFVTEANKRQEKKWQSQAKQGKGLKKNDPKYANPDRDGDTQSSVNNLNNKGNDAVDTLSSDIGKTPSFGSKNKSEYTQEQADKDYELFLKSFGGDTLEEVLKVLEEESLGEKVDCKDFDNLSKSKMIDSVRNINKTLSKIETESKKVDNFFKKIIKSVERAADSIKDDTKASQSTYRAAGALRKMSNTTVTLIKKKADLNKMMAADCQSVLKGYLRYKPVKESYNINKIDGDINILESAMRLV